MGAPRLEELRALYEELEFRADLQALGNAPGVSTPPVEKHYRSITVLEELEAEIAALRQAGSFAIDTETTSQDPMRAELVGLSLAHKPHEAVYIPLRHSYLGVALTTRCHAGVRTPQATPGRSGDTEVRAEHQVRLHCPATSGGYHAWAGLRHHGRRVSAQSLTPHEQFRCTGA